MKELKGIFKPEISPIHKMDYSVATFIDFGTPAVAEKIIPAGTLLKSKQDGKKIELFVVNGVEQATVADVSKPLGVLAHDVKVEVGEQKIPVGVMIKGVVYADVMRLANTKENYTDAVIAALAPNILTYGVVTLKDVTGLAD